MEWNDERIEQIMANGIAKCDHTTLVHAYRYVTGGNYSGGCSGCFKRRAQRAIIKYHQEIIDKRKIKEKLIIKNNKKL